MTLGLVNVLAIGDFERHYIYIIIPIINNYIYHYIPILSNKIPIIYHYMVPRKSPQIIINPQLSPLTIPMTSMAMGQNMSQPHLKRSPKKKLVFIFMFMPLKLIIKGFKQVLIQPHMFPSSPYYILVLVDPY